LIKLRLKSRINNNSPTIILMRNKKMRMNWGGRKIFRRKMMNIKGLRLEIVCLIVHNW
jgi:hypothetical protein